MKIYIIDSSQPQRVEKAVVRAAVQRALNLEKASEKSEVSVALVDDEAIKKLNLSYRGKDRATDVLSFPVGETEHQEMENYLGDIVISVDTAESQAEEYKHSLVIEMELLAVHGTLHLLGYDDETPPARKEMMQRQDAIMRSLGARIAPFAPVEDDGGVEENGTGEEATEAVAEAPKKPSASQRRRRARARKKREIAANASETTDRQL